MEVDRFIVNRDHDNGKCSWRWSADFAAAQKRAGNALLGMIKVLNAMNTRTGEGLRSTRPGGGERIICPTAISAPRRSRNTKLGRWIGSHNKSFWWKFHNLESTLPRSNDVIDSNLTQFFSKHAGLLFSWPGIQTKEDRTRQMTNIGGDIFFQYLYIRKKTSKQTNKQTQRHN